MTDAQGDGKLLLEIADLHIKVGHLRAVNAALEKENRLMNQSISNCASDLLTAAEGNAALVEALTDVALSMDAEDYWTATIKARAALKLAKETKP